MNNYTPFKISRARIHHCYELFLSISPSAVTWMTVLHYDELSDTFRMIDLVF